jgi:GDPmannose 4,6-dehydratase
MLQKESPDDYVIATGETQTLENFVTHVFSKLNLEWTEHIDINQSLFRPSDITYSAADPKKSLIELGWEPTISFTEIINRLVEAELRLQSGDVWKSDSINS